MCLRCVGVFFFYKEDAHMDTNTYGHTLARRVCLPFLSLEGWLYILHMAGCGISCNLFSHPACLLQGAIFHALIANQPDDTETNTDRSHCNAENVDLEGYDIQTVPNRLACRYRLYV